MAQSGHSEGTDALRQAMRRARARRTPQCRHGGLRLADATPMEIVETERQGVTGKYVKDLAKELGIASIRIFRIIDLPRATVGKKAAGGGYVAGRSGHAALALTRLVAIAASIVADSMAPDAEGFDAPDDSIAVEDVFDAVGFQRLRLKEIQQIPEWPGPPTRTGRSQAVPLFLHIR